MKNLLVPVDFSDVTDRVVSTAEEMARAFGAKVWLVHCVDEYPTVAAMGEVPFTWPSPDEELPERFPEEQRRLRALTASLLEKGVNAEMLLIRGSAIPEILDFAERHQVDMIIMGSHGHSAWYELVVGTVSEGVLRRAHCPALIVPSETGKKTEKVAAYQREAPLATPF